MIKDFGAWLSGQGQSASESEPQDQDEEFPLDCTGCGKHEWVNRSAYENGDTGWYSDNPESGKGRCGGSQWCTP